MKILPKLLILLLAITVVPLGILGYLAIQDSRALSMSVADDAKLMGEAAIADSTAALNSLGEDIIKQKAVDVAKQMEIYIKAHPEMTVTDLQNDPYFFDIATQEVGITGYTTAWDSATSIDRFHYSDHIMNLDLHTLAEKIPTFWDLIGGSEGGKTIYGYYDFVESDGTINQKYMYILPISAETADGVVLNVAATTYIDEFNGPAAETQAKIDATVTDTLDRIKASTEGLSTKNTIMIMTLVVILAVVVIGFFFARSITKPLTELSDVAHKLSEGNPDVIIPDIKTKDEIHDLGNSLKSAIAAVQILIEEARQAPTGSEVK
ncbi:MAG: HAMP domain-containing protein [Dehalococcoidales bacterium]|nr:HAMP domain-containing protein [Dehalococcoidales bacterium]